MIGWFHSHPTFYPNPSLQDIDTQLSMQEYLSNVYSPFVGVILSPFRTFTNTLMSEYRCIIVDKNEKTKDGFGVPYKFSTDVYSDNFNIKTTLRHAESMLLMETNIPEEFIIDFSEPYFHDKSITYLDKVGLKRLLISSLQKLKIMISQTVFNMSGHKTKLVCCHLCVTSYVVSFAIYQE